MSFNSPSIFFFLLLLSLPPPSLSETLPEQAFLPVSSTSPSSTIPSFPEQSAVSACPVSLPSSLFPSVRSSCIDGHGSSGYGPLHRSRCCPVLAAWLYSSYAPSSLSRRSGSAAGSYDMPLLPDDSETCVDALEAAMSERGLELPRPNATCDVVYCYCGIRLRQMSCAEAFYVDGKGDLVGDHRVQRLETDCSGGGGGNGGLAGCSKCLSSLNKLNKGKTGNSTAMSERTSKMRLKDCQLMGLTWLLAKNRGKYMHTVTSVLRVIMMSEAQNGMSPKSCSLNSDGLPLAVDSYEVSRASFPVGCSSCFFLTLWCLMYISLGELLAVHRIS